MFLTNFSLLLCNLSNLTALSRENIGDIVLLE